MKFLLRKKKSQALELIKEICFDLILLDVNLNPNTDDTSGLDLCKEIKSMKLRRHIPIILITGHGSIEMAVRAMDIGAFYFLTKPIIMGQLLLLMKRALENSALHREVANLRTKIGNSDPTCPIIGKKSENTTNFPVDCASSAA